MTVVVSPHELQRLQLILRTLMSRALPSEHYDVSVDFSHADQYDSLHFRLTHNVNKMTEMFTVHPGIYFSVQDTESFDRLVGPDLKQACKRLEVKPLTHSLQHYRRLSAVTQNADLLERAAIVKPELQTKTVTAQIASGINSIYQRVKHWLLRRG